MIVPLHVFNPTPHDRTQWVIYGSTKPHNVFMKLPRSYVNVAYVTVPPGQTDQLIEVDTEAGPEGDGLLSHAVQATLAQEFRPFLMIDGNKHYFVLSEITDLAADFTVGTWLLKGSGCIAFLWTYYGRQDDIMRFEMSYYAESLDELRKRYKVSFGVDASGVIIESRGKDHNKLMDGWLLDGQGNRLLGSFLFYRMAFNSANKGRLNTIFAELAYPLYALHEWKWWGPWRKTPIPISDKEFRRQQGNKLSQRWQDPLTYPGYILAKQPGVTGAQSGFGTWQHLPTIGAKRSDQMLPDQWICGQEACRPIHFFEEDGGELDVTKHPNFVAWNELPHWHPNVSPDRLRRTHDWDDLNTWSDWFGHDHQHYGNIWLAEDVMLNGSFASMFELRMKATHLRAGLTLPSQKPRHATNAGLSGRAAGRVLLSVVYNWMATGDEKLLNHISKRFDEVMESQFTMANSPGPLHPSRIICNDDRVFGPDKCGWIVWEDALMVMGLDALVGAFKDLQDWERAASMDRIVRMIAHSVANHGWHPTRDIIAKAILWDIKKKTQPPLTSQEWDDKNKAALSTGTDFGHWARPCLEIASRDGLQRAVDLLKSLGNETEDPTRHTYMGAE